MKNHRTLRFVMAAMLAAFTCVATMIIKIPIPATGGYIHPGDCAVLLAGMILGPLCGGAAAGVGSALADLFSGYAAYIPATFFIKGLTAVLAGLLVRNIAKDALPRILLTSAAAELFMTAGYFGFEAFFMGYGIGAAAAVPGNLLQSAGGVILTAILIPVVRRIDVSGLRDQAEHSVRGGSRRN